MAKSINDYYAEKMQKLLEMQSANNSATLSSPEKSAEQGAAGNKRPDGRGYYDNFRTRVDSASQTTPPQRSAPKRNGPRPANPLDRDVIDSVRRGKHPSGPYRSPNDKNHEQDKGKGPQGSARPKINPEQTARDKYEEHLRKLEAMKAARRGKIFRQVRDAAVSAVLIVAVFAVMCVVVYRLLFVIKDLSVTGGVAYTEEEIIAASGVDEGDHLFSFSSRKVGETMILRCPEIKSVDVERTPPGSIAFNVEEEQARFYADFYGEYRLLSSTLRVLGSVTEEDAKARGCIKLKIPDVVEATAGLFPKFNDVRDDSYMTEVAEELLNSPLGERAVTLNLVSKYSLVVNIDGKYIISLGDSENIGTKLAIAEEVLKDPMFLDDIKATIDVSDLSATSVIVDTGLKVD